MHSDCVFVSLCSGASVHVAILYDTFCGSLAAICDRPHTKELDSMSKLESRLSAEPAKSSRMSYLMAHCSRSMFT